MGKIENRKMRDGALPGDGRTRAWDLVAEENARMDFSAPSFDSGIRLGRFRRSIPS